MTKSDSGTPKNKKGRRGPRFTVQYSEEIQQRVEDERLKKGYNSSSPIYQEAIKFYLDNKDKRIFMNQEELDNFMDDKLEQLLTDKKRLAALKNVLLTLNS
jgi:hypothetical protein